MGSSFPINKQTVVGLLTLLLFIWTLSMFTQTSPKSLTHITHKQPPQPIVPEKPPGSAKGKLANVPEQPMIDKSKPVSDTSGPDGSPQFTLPPWYEEDDDKAAAADSLKSSKSAPSSSRDKALILYAFADSASALENLKFFVSQGLHDAADFVFIFNSETEASSIIPKKKNIRVVNRPNTCFDLGAFGEVLRKDNLYKKYKRFITLNASIRGPFLPYWGAQSCWSDLFLDRVTDKVKLVGMTANCWPRFHVQSMIWATDDVGIDLLLNPSMNLSVDDGFGVESDPIGLAGCYDSWKQAVHAEIGSTSAILTQGYQVDVMMAAFHKSKNYIEECDPSENGDVLWNGKYFGTNIHPYETVFIKANRDIDPILIDHLTKWQQASGFNSYSSCSASS